MEITNRAAGPRVVNVVAGKGKDGPIVEARVLQPGETADVEVHQPDHPATKAMFDSGDLMRGRPETQAQDQADAKAAELKAEYDRGYADGQKAAEEAAKGQRRS